MKRPQIRPQSGENVTTIRPAHLAASGHCIYCGRHSGRSLACREHRDLLGVDPVLKLAGRW